MVTVLYKSDGNSWPSWSPRIVVTTSGASAPTTVGAVSAMLRILECLLGSAGTSRLEQVWQFFFEVPADLNRSKSGNNFLSMGDHEQRMVCNAVASSFGGHI